MSAEETICITFESEGTDSKSVCVTAEPGELLTQVAERAQIVIQQSCGGTPSCTDCVVKVLENKDGAFLGMEGPEKRLLGNVYHITGERLACQAKVSGSCRILVPNAKKIHQDNLNRKKVIK